MATTTSAGRDQAWDPPPCPAASLPEPAAAGAWWRLDPRLESGGLTGQRLTLGRTGLSTPRSLDLDAESFAAGPLGPSILVGTDDGGRSRISLIDVGRLCSEAVAVTPDVVRRGILLPDRTAIIETRVARADRADIGVFLRPLAPGLGSRRLLGPIEPDARFGPTWTTELVMGDDGRRLAVQSCGAIACRTRVVDLVDGSIAEVADPSHGDLVGLAGDRLVLHEACGGLPCPLVSIRSDGTGRVTLDPLAWQAVVTVGRDGPRVVYETGPDGRSLRVARPDGSDVRDLGADPQGRRLVPTAPRAGGAMDLQAGSYLLAPDGRVPLEALSPPTIRRLAESPARRPHEVLP